MSNSVVSPQIILIIHNVRSAANVGSMLRTADGSGVKEVWLTGYTPTPAHPEKRYLTTAEKSLAKTALGAERTVVWRKHKAIGSLLASLRTSGYQIVALEQARHSVALENISEHTSVAVIVGNEVRGIHQSILEQCDVIIELPMYGQKQSLNVAVACGIALYGIRCKMKK